MDLVIGLFDSPELDSVARDVEKVLKNTIENSL